MNSIFEKDGMPHTPAFAMPPKEAVAPPKRQPGSLPAPFAARAAVYTGPLATLFFLEVCLLAAFAGILATRLPVAGAVALALLPLLDGARSLRPRSFCFLLLFFALAFAYATLRAPSAPPVPEWLATAAGVPLNDPAELKRAKAVWLDATVDSISLLQGGRQRVILANARPHMPKNDSGQYEPYLGKIVCNVPAADRLTTASAHQAGATGAADTAEAADTAGTPGEAPVSGERVSVLLRLAPVRGFSNPGQWDAREYWHDRGVWLRGSIVAQRGQRGAFGPPLLGESATAVFPQNIAVAAGRWREAVRAAFCKALPAKEAASILPALVFGDRSGISHAFFDMFARATLAHSLALSGLHLGFAVLLGAAAARVVGAVFPGVWQSIPRAPAALFFSLPFALGYLWLGQAPISLLRAFFMLVFWVLPVFLRKPRAFADGLFAALAVLLLIDPLALFDLGLQLSALSIAAIALCLPYITSFAKRVAARIAGASAGRRLARRGVFGALSLLGVSLCIQIVLLPLTAKVFGSSGWLFMLNALWLPVLALVVLPCSFAAVFAVALGLPDFAPPLLVAASLPGEALYDLLAWLENAGWLGAIELPRPHWLSLAGYWVLCLVVPGLALRGARPGQSAEQATGQLAGQATGQLAGQATGQLAGQATGQLAGQTAEQSAEQLAEQATNVLPCRAGARAIARRLYLRRYGLPLLGVCMLAAFPLWRLYESRFVPSVSVRLLDVGQGQSVLIEWAGLDGKNGSGRALVDGGGFPLEGFDVGKMVLAPVLADNALPRVDVLIATHRDVDHLGGLLYLLEHFTVGRYFSGEGEGAPFLARREGMALAAKGAPVKERLVKGDTVPLGPELALEVLWPPEFTESPEPSESPEPPESPEPSAFPVGLPLSHGGLAKDAAAAPEAALRRYNGKTPGARKGGNESSLIMRLVWQGRPLALLCGDAVQSGVEALVADAAQKPESIKAEVLILPHHGSKGSLSLPFYDAVAPQVALAACGRGNRFAFPSSAVQEALAGRGVPLYDTGRCGQIGLAWKAPGQAPAVRFAHKVSGCEPPASLPALP